MPNHSYRQNIKILSVFIIWKLYEDIIFNTEYYPPPIIKTLVKYSYTKWKLPRNTCKKIPLTPIINKSIKLWYKVYLWSTPTVEWELEIWDYTSFSGYTKFYIHNWYKISFWKFCSIADWASFIASAQHDYSCLTTNTYIFTPNISISVWKNINIWHDVRIWKNAIILKWVCIWTWAIIWAWSIVSKDIPPYAIAVWNPAKVIKYRFDDKTIKKLLESERWNRDVEKIKKNYNLEFIR